MQKLIAILSLSALAACAAATETVNSDATPAQLQKSTAQFFKTSTGNVRVSGLKATLVGTEYRAQVGRGLYDCHYIRGAISCDAVRSSSSANKNPWAY